MFFDKPSVQEEPKQAVMDDKQLKEVPLTTNLSNVLTSVEPKSLTLTPVEVEKTLRLASDIQLATKDFEIAELKASQLDHALKLLEKNTLLIEKEKEIIKLRKDLKAFEVKDAKQLIETKRKNYKEHTKEISARLKINFDSCFFDPITGFIEVNQ